MMKYSKVKKAREKEFSIYWETLVNRINNSKKPLILKLFGSKFPTSKLQKTLSKKFFDDGFYAGAMYMAEQIPENGN